MPDITNYDGRLEQMVYYCEAMLDNIAKVNNAYHDSAEAEYAATLPSHLIKWKGIKKIGGKTIAWNQLVDTGTTTVTTISGHIYYTLIEETASIVTSDGTAISVVDDTADMVVDLTLCFGSGNEPSTTDEFDAIFGAAHYAYNEGELLSAGVTEVISKDSGDNTLQTYSVPAEVKALEGYGWSAGSVCNYVDFENKKFVQNVGRIILDGTQTVTDKNIYSPMCRVCYSVSNVAPFTNVNVVDDSIVSSYLPAASNQETVAGARGILRRANGSSEIVVSLGTGAATYLEEFNQYLADNPLTVYYALDTPVETDISAYLTDENITEAESGGSIIFETQHGDGFQIPVPVQMEYIGV